jgi:hypothetical protein
VREGPLDKGQRPWELPKKPCGLSFIKVEKQGHGDTSRYPLPPFSIKTKMPQEREEEFLVDMVGSFFQV